MIRKDTLYNLNGLKFTNICFIAQHTGPRRVCILLLMGSLCETAHSLISTQFMSADCGLGPVSVARLSCQAVPQSLTALLLLLNGCFISGQSSAAEYIHSHCCTTITSLRF